MISLPASEEARAAAAHARLAALYRYARRTRFWRHRLADAVSAEVWARDPFAALREVAPVSKHELRLAGAAAVLDGWVRPWWPSSIASDAEPFRVHYDLRAWRLLRYEAKLRARAACGITPEDRIAVIDAIPPAREGRSLPEVVRPFQRISTRQPAAAVAEKLVLHHPSAVYGRASALLEAACALDAAGRRLPLRAVFTCGEPLDSATRAALAHAFGAPVLDVYASSATKEIAWECRAGGRHINADLLHVEILGAGGAALPPGEEGEIVVTVLVNRAMPLLRYRTGDRGHLVAVPCSCGTPLPLLAIASGAEPSAEGEAGRRSAGGALTLAMEPLDPAFRVGKRERRGFRSRGMPWSGAERRRTDHGIRAALRFDAEHSIDPDRDPHGR
ncbi:MAG TPA: hypothetical protein VFK09_08180 [Gemmatimonadales bacterium]|nr:hypothetical protein [Gemmatimonadales bacterium]